MHLLSSRCVIYKPVRRYFLICWILFVFTNMNDTSNRAIVERSSIKPPGIVRILFVLWAPQYTVTSKDTNIVIVIIRTSTYNTFLPI